MQVALPSCDDALAGMGVCGSADDALQGLSDLGCDVVESERPQPTPSRDWDRWLQHFEQMDLLAEQKEEQQLELESAVRGERYADAAACKKRLEASAEQDSIQSVLQQLETALETEQYDNAARLRDEAMTGLQGWWCGQAENDPQGHLLHVTAEYGRWTGKVYTPRDLAELKGWSDDYGPQLRNQFQDKEPVSLDEVRLHMSFIFHHHFILYFS